MHDQWRTRLWLGVAVGILFTTGCEQEAQNQAASTQQPSAKEKTETSDTISGAWLIDDVLDGNIKEVRLALENGVDVDAANDQGSTALMIAGFNGHEEIVGLLLDHGASVDALDAVGRTALMYSASGPVPDIVRILLENGADPNLSEKSENFTALMFAAGEGQAEVVRVLLRYGASSETIDADGETALDFARSNGHSEVVQLLENTARDLNR